MNYSLRVKKRYILLLLVVIALSWFSNSFYFRMTDQEVENYFKGIKSPVIEYIGIDDHKMRYLWMDNDKNTTVIFVHGAPGSSSAFIDYFKNNELIQEVNLISIDRLGYGYSDFGKVVISLKEQAEAIKQVKVYHELEKVILVGHSLGAPIIGQAVFDHPDLYDGLLLVSGSVDPELEEKEWYRPWLRNTLMKSVLPTTFYTTNEEIYHLKEQLVDLKTKWNQLNLPVIVIHGKADQLVPVENTVFLRERIPARHCEIWLEPGVNHFIPWNRPDLIVNGILKLERKL